jgi:hypothetical protein
MRKNIIKNYRSVKSDRGTRKRGETLESSARKF